MHSKGIRIIAIMLLLFIPFSLLFWPMPQQSTLVSADNDTLPQSFSTKLEQYVKNRFPFSAFLGRLRFDLLLFSGQYEQNGVFINSSGLLKRIALPDTPTIKNNVDVIIRFANEARTWDCPVFVSIFPSASAIYQQNLPPFSNTVNQRQFIDDTLMQLSGHVIPISMYSHLDAQRKQYIFYRTEDNLTSLGGFHVYSQLLSRMLNVEPPTLQSYNLSYPVNNYFGDLYERSPYNEVEPDSLTLFHYTNFNREYIVTHTSLTTRKTYNTLFPEHLAALGRETDIFMGGLSAVTNINSSAPYSRKLLIFGDKSALAYAPFLANHYQQITIVDLFDPDLTVSGISLQNYTQVLFAYNAETLMTQKIPSDILLERIMPTEA